MKCGLGYVISVNYFRMFKLPAECVKTLLLGLKYGTKWVKYADDKLVSIYFKLFSFLRGKKSKYDSVDKLLSK